MSGQTLKAKLSKGGVITRWAAAAAVAALLFLAGTSARAQSNTSASSVITHYSATAGFVPGQTLRLTASNPEAAGDIDSDGRPDLNDLITAAVTLFDADGRVIYQSPEAAIPAGRFHNFDISRADLAAAGEPRTGRLEVRAELVIKAAPGRGESECAAINLSKQGTGTLTLFDDDSGKTAIALLLPAVQKVREAARR